MEHLSYGERIAHYRKKLGLSQKELAELVGTTAETISNYENDAPNPDHAIISNISTVLGITSNKTLTGFYDVTKNQPLEGLIKNTSEE